MRWFRVFIHLILLTTTPALLAHSSQLTLHMKVHSKKLHHNFKREGSYHLISYDEVLDLLDEIESGKAEKKYRKKDLKRIDRFLIYLAKEGSLTHSDTLALEKDIADLLKDEDNDMEYASVFESQDRYFIISPEADLVLWGYWFKKKGNKAKKFVKKHKKEIIIGAVIVVATAVIVVAVVGATSAGAAAAVGAATGAASSSGSEKKKKSKSSQKEEFTVVPVEITKEAPILKATIDEHVFSFKEFMSEDVVVQQSSSQGWNDFSFAEKARELGAFFAHEACGEISELVSVVPQLCEEIKDIGSKFLPESPSLSNDGSSSGSPIGNYENLVANGHKVIDSAFSTDQSELFTTEAKANDLMNSFAIGIIPLPGMISRSGSINVKRFSNLGRAADRASFTKAGRGLTKHGYREGSVFPKPVGNPSQVNQHGQKVLDNILNHPEKKVIQYTHKLHGPVIDIEAPQLGGVRFNGDGTEMMGFLEPRWFTNNP